MITIKNIAENNAIRRTMRLLISPGRYVRCAITEERYMILFLSSQLNVLQQMG